MSYIQAILFDKQKWNAVDAKKWLKSHKYKAIKPVHITDQYLRYRLKTPNDDDEYRTESIGNDIKLIIGFPFKRT